MADEFSLTRVPVRVAAPGRQPLNQALEVADYDEINALLGLLGVEGSSTGVTISIITAMQNDTEDGWVPLFTFTNLTGPNTHDAKNATTGLLKYIRWHVTALGGANAVVFSINGMLRTRG